VAREAVIEQNGLDLRRRRLLKDSDLIYAVEAGSNTCRLKSAEIARWEDTITQYVVVAIHLAKELHLRFQRTFPSFVSSRIIPRSNSSLRTRSDAAKSRRCRAACLSATSFSISTSVVADSPES
jgi:hypothetical protein